MKKIEFEYKDAYTNGRWAHQACILPSVEDCIELYGLGEGCEYRILSVEEV